MLKKFLFGICFMILTLVSVLVCGDYVKQTNKYRIKHYNSTLSPVILIPGSSASVNRFDRLVKQINQDASPKHSLLKVKVLNSGRIIYQGKILRHDREPFIVIGFENNHDGYQNIKKQAQMVDICLEDLSSRYDFNNCKCFGHSNGGLVWTYFLEHQAQNYDIDFKRLMTVGSPYNFAEKKLQHKTQMLADFIKNKHKLSTTLQVYSILGTQTYTSDGIVPEESVEAGKYIFQKQVKSFTQIEVTGNQAGHSDLPQNKQIIDLIDRYLLDHKNRTASPAS